MREIKFRGLSKLGEWIYGNYATTKFPYPRVVIINNDGFGHVEVLPKTVGQFTGLKDSNGVDIYEGDIVTWGDIEGYTELSGTRYAVVDFSTPSDGLTFAAFKPSNHRFKIGNFMYAKSTNKCMTVIGNIHEKPELLKP